MTEADRRARAQMWTRLRVLVIDLESTVHGGRHRIVSGVALSLVGGKVTSTWHQLHVNPGVPIDAMTQRKHRITDDMVKDAPSFAAVAPSLLPHLVQAPGEVLVLCAHNARFDIPLLRTELEKAGHALPDLPVLDTMGAFPPLVGVFPAGRGLEHLGDELRVTNSDRHSALGDARATAEAAAILLDRAADAGYFTISRLLAKLEAGRAATLRFSRPAEMEPALVPVLSPEHQATDAIPLASVPDAMTLATWLASVEDCAMLHCPNLASRVEAAGPSGAVLVPLLIDRLRTISAGEDHAAVATLLGALLTRVSEIVPAATEPAKQVARTTAIALDDLVAPLLQAHPRCAHPRLCPDCLVGDPCPLDMWRHRLAPMVLSTVKLVARASNFLPTFGSQGRGTYWALRTSGHEQLADAGLRLILRTLRDAGQNDVADATAQRALAGGSLDAEVAQDYALAVSVGGRKPDLEAGLPICDRVLAVGSSESTDPARLGLEVRQAQIRGRLRRLEEAGRRHHPINPRRVRTPRFLRP